MLSVEYYVSQKGLLEVIAVTWNKNDKDNPRNWSDIKKTWSIIVVNIYMKVARL